MVRKDYSVEIEIIIGVAGSGKTTELLKRIEDSSITDNYTDFGFATYTRAGRKEAVDRASKVWNCDPDVLQYDGWFRTHTSAALKLIKEDDFMRHRRVLNYSAANHRNFLKGVFGLDTLRTHGLAWSPLGMEPEIDGPIGAAMSSWSRVRHSPGSILEEELRKQQSDGRLGALTVESAMRSIDKYEREKQKEGFLDFTDILLAFVGLKADVYGPTTNVLPIGEPPDVVEYVFDEHQDCSELLNEVSKRLCSGERCKKVTICGDPNQSIYGFMGASTEVFEGWGDNVKRTYLYKTYRNPHYVLEVAEKVLDSREPEFARPREVPVTTTQGLGTRNISRDFWRIFSKYCLDTQPKALIKGNVESDRSVMILTRTQKQVEQWRQYLIEGSYPYRVNGESDDGMNHDFKIWHRAMRLSAGMAVSINQVIGLLKETTIGFSPKYVDQLVKKHDWLGRYDAVTIDDFLDMGIKPEMVELLKDEGLHIWRRMIRNGNSSWNAIDWYPKYWARPPILLSTFHGAKGMEADAVIIDYRINHLIFKRCKESKEFRDSEIRLLYTGITRARHSVHIPELRYSPEYRADDTQAHQGITGRCHLFGTKYKYVMPGVSAIAHAYNGEELSKTIVGNYAPFMEPVTGPDSYEGKRTRSSLCG